ncbi:MAG: T9SS type A sorting domain-containing protein [Ignavibacteriae bacterium]|nr:T9SS type A sorting domain-containing protein [Ignavibacteriota bacterium]MCB9242790.1 T9SS type A sorting domain-containing protein [Ignavibacteriales bacterium]
MKTLLLIILSLIIVPNTGLFAQSGSQLQIKPYRIEKIDDYFVGVPFDRKYEVIPKGRYTYITTPSPVFDASYSILGQDYLDSIQFVWTSGETIFDQQSNSCPVQIWQDPTSPQFIHVVHMASPMEDNISFQLRRTKYYFSSDFGATWNFRAELPSNTRSGYGVIDGLSDGSIIIANHYINSGLSINRTIVFREVFPQLGSFDRLDPGLGTTGQVEWPRMVASDNINGAVKFALVSSGNETDSAFYNYCNGFIGNGQFGQWKFFRSRNDECYAIARSDDGKVGVAFINNNERIPSDYGDVFFMESTDMGASYSAPIKIFDADYTSPTADSLGGFRGISLVYTNNKARIVFETVFQDGIESYFPGIASNIRYWTPSLPGNDPNRSIIIVDSLDVPFNPHQGVNDLLTGLCRPVIGRSRDGSALFMVFVVADSVLGGSHTPTSFNNIYLTASVNNGFNWKAPVRINGTSPRRDWVYPSISTTNDQNSSKYYVNLVAQSDVIPGSYPSGSANGKSLAKQMFIRIGINKPLLVNPISNEIPDEFYLYQNYPNPFNPETTIRFSIAKRSLVSLKVYDVKGVEVRSLIGNSILNAGTYETNFLSNRLSSGIYYYTLRVGVISYTKKMVLVK